MNKEVLERNWACLPADLLATIFSRLETAHLLGSAQFVCASWRHASKIPSAFQSIRIAASHSSEAARRSDGNVTELDISFLSLWDDDLLNLVTYRTTRIRRLRLADCDIVSDRGLMESAPNLPLLEDLEISRCPFVSKLAVESIGNRCPLLRSFIYYATAVMGEVAQVIGSAMPGLRHLELRRNGLTIDGVEAILNGCPNLDHLHLSYCYILEFIVTDDKLVSKLRNRVRNLVLRADYSPLDSYIYDCMLA